MRIKLAAMKPSFWQRFWTSYRVDLLVALLFVVLTAVTARNIWPNLDKAIVGFDFDVYINPWADWWTAKALTDSSLSFWQTDYIFYPQTADLTYHSFSHVNTAVSLALQTFFEPLVAYNLTILLNYVLAGLAMFQFVRYLTGSITAAILASIIFAFNSHNLFQSAHPVLVSVWCLPWTARYFIQAVRTNQTKYALIAAFFVWLGTLTSMLLTFIIALWLIFFWLYIFFAPDWPRPSWRITFIFGATCALFILPTVYPQLVAALANDNTSFSVSPRDVIPLDLIAIFIPTWFEWLSWTIYLGVIPMAFIILARHCGRVTLPWYLLLIGSFLFAIGPYPRLVRQPLDMYLPWSMPLIPFLRNPYRLSILLSFALGFLVAYGWLALSARITNPRTRLIVFVVIAVLIYVDYTAVGLPITPLKVSPFFTDYLVHAPADGALAMLPTGRAEGKVHLYYQTLHERKMTSGVISRPTVETFAFIHSQPLLRAGANDLPPVPIPADISHQLAELADLDISYLVIDKFFLESEQVKQWQLALPFTPAYEDERILAYATEPQLGRDYEVLYSLTASLALATAVTNLQPDGSQQLTLGWLAQQPPSMALDYEITWGDEHSVRQPLTADFPTDQWSAQEIVVTQNTLNANEPITAVRLTLYESGQGAPLHEPVLIRLTSLPERP